jgi:predicted transcriptional regulator
MSNLELLKTIVSHQPESIRYAATAVDRDYRDVHRNLQELESLGVIEFETHGNRKQPKLRNGAETIDLSIRFPELTDDGELLGASV